MLSPKFVNDGCRFHWWHSLYVSSNKFNPYRQQWYAHGEAVHSAHWAHNAFSRGSLYLSSFTFVDGLLVIRRVK